MEKQVKPEEKIFSLKFEVVDTGIQTTIHQKNISPHEAIGLLHIVINEMICKVSQGKQKVFEASGNSFEKTDQ